MSNYIIRRITLLADGPTDRALPLPIIQWLWAQHFPQDSVELQFADFSATKPAGFEKGGGSTRLKPALHLFPCDVLFIHRDAESYPPERRYEEVEDAILGLPPHTRPPHVCVVPVKMSEAWMLSDDSGAIRKAAGNPNGQDELKIPSVAKWESLPDPKQLLYSLLSDACGLPARRRQRFNAARATDSDRFHRRLYSAQTARGFSKAGAGGSRVERLTPLSDVSARNHMQGGCASSIAGA